MSLKRRDLSVTIGLDEFDFDDSDVLQRLRAARLNELIQSADVETTHCQQDSDTVGKL